MYKPATRAAFFLDLLRQFITFILGVLQLAAPFFASLAGQGEPLRLAHAPLLPYPEMPAPYTGAIGCVIIILAFFYAVYQAFPGHRDNPLFRQIGVYTACALAMNSLRLVALQLYPDLLSIHTALEWLLGGSALLAFFRLHRYKQPLQTKEYWLVKPFLGLLSGWMAVMALLQGEVVCRQLYHHPLPFSPLILAFLALILAFIAGMVCFTQVNFSRWFGLGLLWAFIGIMVKNIVYVPHTGMAIVAGIMVSIITFCVFQFRH